MNTFTFIFFALSVVYANTQGFCMGDYCAPDPFCIGDVCVGVPPLDTIVVRSFDWTSLNIKPRFV